jgi:hypothetical protein
MEHLRRIGRRAASVHNNVHVCRVRRGGPRAGRCGGGGRDWVWGGGGWGVGPPAGSRPKGDGPSDMPTRAARLHDGSGRGEGQSGPRPRLGPQGIIHQLSNCSHGSPDLRPKGVGPPRVHRTTRKAHTWAAGRGTGIGHRVQARRSVGQGSTVERYRREQQRESGVDGTKNAQS